MSLGSTLKHVLGFVAGILIPGANLTHTDQQELADKIGQVAADLAERLKTDTTGMSGPDKVFVITKSLVAEAQSPGFCSDVQILEAVALDIAQAAYRKTIANRKAGSSPSRPAPRVAAGAGRGRGAGEVCDQLANDNDSAAAKPAAA